jgi:integrase
MAQMKVPAPLARLSKAKREAELPIRFHDLRHTFGHRLRAAGVSIEDRKALLGRSNGEITTHYSAADLESMIANIEAIVGTAPRTVLRTGVNPVSSSELIRNF